jgi:hypothetical protein
LSVYIFFRPAFFSPTSPPLFSYLRYEAVIGIVGNLSSSYYGLSVCADLLPLLNNPISQWIQCYIAIPLYNISYYAKFLMEIAIVIDRILMLAPSIGSHWGLYDLLKIRRPYLVFIGICIFSTLVNYPYIYLNNAPLTNTLINYGYPEYHVFIYYSYSKTSWSSWGNSGYYTILFMHFFKNVVTFSVETFLNVLSLVLFQRHLAHKSLLTGASVAMTRTNRSIQKESARTVRSSSTTNLSRSESGAGGRNMAYLVLFMSVTGVIHSVLLFAYTLWAVLITKTTVSYKALQFSAFLATTLRHGINFVQCYLFNTSFRMEANAVIAKFKPARVRP